MELIEALIDAGKHVDEADLDKALGVIRAHDPGWRAAYLAARVRGLLAAHTGRLEDASSWFMQAELLAAAHEGPGSLAAAMEHSNRALTELQAGRRRIRIDYL